MFYSNMKKLVLTDLNNTKKIEPCISYCTAFPLCFPSWTLLKFPRVSGLKFQLQGAGIFFSHSVATREFRKADFRVRMERTICPTARLKVSLALMS